MNLKTNYLGFELRNPLVIGACPISHDLDKAKRCEDAGASAIVMYSLFEEQLVREQRQLTRALLAHAEAYAEAVTYLPEPEALDFGPERYLEQIRKLKRSLEIPVIASLNGVSYGGWVKFAKLMQDAGADALELNTYNLATDPEKPAEQIESMLLMLVQQVRESVRIPLAVKLSPFYSALPNISARLVKAGVNGLVLFNRFYQPDINPVALEVVRLHLSDPSELSLRLHWLAILYGNIGNVSLAVTGGVHSATDIVKSVMAGASVTQMVSAPLRNGPACISRAIGDLKQWLIDHEYDSITQMLGSMSLQRCPKPAEYVRDNYMQVLHSWTD